jgi:hypothetical protein
VNFLDLAALELFFNVKVKANQAEYYGDRFGVGVGGLHGEGVDDVLEDKSGPAHGVDVDFVECGA